MREEPMIIMHIKLFVLSLDKVGSKHQHELGDPIYLV